ncbi:MAG: hypothetical protein L0226_02605 [Acidobacteria bacterium]|nr:hypothetical protein [Acidobacteriota bacterium]
MILRLLFIISCLFFFAPAAWGQATASGQTPPEEQNETMIDTLKRMQIKREENEHKKLLEKGTQIKEEAESLAREVKDQSSERLPHTAEKKLKEIEKFAKQIRSESGGSQDEPLDLHPTNLAEALKQLCEASERLNANLAKTSRRVVSLAVVDDATEVIQLIKILRGYLN